MSIPKIQDRVSNNPNRYRFKKVSTGEFFYGILSRNDEPTELGTPLTADVFNSLRDDVYAYAPKHHSNSEGSGLMDFGQASPTKYGHARIHSKDNISTAPTTEHDCVASNVLYQTKNDIGTVKVYLPSAISFSMGAYSEKNYNITYDFNSLLDGLWKPILYGISTNTTFNYTLIDYNFNNNRNKVELNFNIRNRTSDTASYYTLSLQPIFVLKKKEFLNPQY